MMDVVGMDNNFFIPRERKYGQNQNADMCPSKKGRLMRQAECHAWTWDEKKMSKPIIWAPVSPNFAEKARQKWPARLAVGPNGHNT